MNTTSEQIFDIEKHIINKIRHRLQISGGHCSITVRSLAKAVALDVGLITREESPPREFYVLVDQLLRDAGGVFWMHGYGGQLRYERTKMRSSIASRIYTFNPQAAMEAMLAHV